MTAEALPAVSPAPLSQLMREGSRAEHEAAESTGFVTALLEGRIPVEGYVAYLRRLERVYAALEQSARTLGNHPVGAAVFDHRLERAARLAEDLTYWSGAGWRATPIESPALTAYEERLLQIPANPDLLVAHHYTRYLGDLAGGQVVGRAVERVYQPVDGAGLAFYDFSAVGKPKPYRDAYRTRVDSLGLSAERADVVVDEVRAAFVLNHGLFVELGVEFSHAR